MVLKTREQIKQGEDPRYLPDFAALKEELNKIYHPARPDINWDYAESLCLSLFKQNGLELQSAVWYSYIRTQRNSLSGMNEGLSLVQTLVCQQWSTMWPTQINLRVELLVYLSERLLQSIRSYQFDVEDLSELYRAEKLLNSICSSLQEEDLKQVSKLDRLYDFIDNVIKRLESNASQKNIADQLKLSETKDLKKTLVYVVNKEVKNTDSRLIDSTVKRNRSWIVGLFSGIFLGAGIVCFSIWLWKFFSYNSFKSKIESSFFTIPNKFDLSRDNTLGTSITTEQQEWLVNSTADQLFELNKINPLWVQEQEYFVLNQLSVLLPDDVANTKLYDDWHKQIELNSFSIENLQAWREGMNLLSDLTAKLNSLDERRGNYMTISELKSAVFNIREAFTQKIPLEERLLQLQDSSVKGQLSPTALQQIDSEFKFLLNRYMLIKSNDS